MPRIANRFDTLRRQGRRALIPYITAGDPRPDATVPLMHALVAAGADLIELGVPFSDPMADGPVIQHASERALKHGVGMHDVLAMVRRFRDDDPDTPVILMGYLNPIEVMGYGEFARVADEAGVDGVLTVDLPPEEASPLVEALRSRALDPIFLVAPTSSRARIQAIAAVASGFIYYVSVRGVTGAARLDMDEVVGKLKEIRGFTDLPLGIGFGIDGPERAAQVARVADAVVVGSALVKRVGALADTPEKINSEAAAFVASLRESIDKVGAAA